MDKRIVMTMFGWRDPGGGTILPRCLAVELAARGWEVTVFFAALERIPDEPPYTVHEWFEDGIRLVGVFNRPRPILDVGFPASDIEHPAITRAFGELLDRVRPSVVHWHNLHNLGLRIVGEAKARGIRNVLTPHNLWLICPRSHLERPDRSLCFGPDGDGEVCASCTGGDTNGYRDRLSVARQVAHEEIDHTLAVSEAVRRSLITWGMPATKVSVVRQSLPWLTHLWNESQSPARRRRNPGEVLRLGFIGSPRTHKGLVDLVSAVQLVDGVTLQVYGSPSPSLSQRLRAADKVGVVTFPGPYTPADLPQILAEVDVTCHPSTVWDAAPLAVQESLAGRVPVLGTRMGGISELVTDGVNGVLVAPRQTKQISQAIQGLQEEPLWIEHLAEGIRAPRSWNDYVDEVVRAYSSDPVEAVAPFPLPTTVTWLGMAPRVLEAIRADGRVAVHDSNEQSGELKSPALPFPPEVRIHADALVAPQAVCGRLLLVDAGDSPGVPAPWLEVIRSGMCVVLTTEERAPMYRLEGLVGEGALHVVRSRSVDNDPDGVVRAILSVARRDGASRRPGPLT